MSMTFIEAMALSDEFSHPEKHLCGLCGNHGEIDLRGKVFSPAGVECGVKAFCICANGRAMKRGKENAERIEREGLPSKKTKPPLKNWWVSWEDEGKYDPTKLGPKIVSAWTSGQAFDGSYFTVVALVVARTGREVEEAIDRDYPSKTDRRWRFIHTVEDDFESGDRFKLSPAAQKKLKKLWGKK